MYVLLNRIFYSKKISYKNKPNSHLTRHVHRLKFNPFAAVNHNTTVRGNCVMHSRALHYLFRFHFQSGPRVSSAKVCNNLQLNNFSLAVTVRLSQPGQLFAKTSNVLLVLYVSPELFGANCIKFHVIK